jgi:predicted nucleic acid-binding protein
VITLDANVLIARADESDATHERAVEVLDHHEWDEYATSAVTLAEVLVRPVRDGVLEKMQEDLRALHIIVVAVHDADAPGIAELTALHRLSSPDAAVLHTAMTTSDAIVTFDVRLARVARAIGFPVIEHAPEDLEWWEMPPAA